MKEIEVRMERERKISEQIITMLEQKLSNIISEVKNLKQRQAQETQLNVEKTLEIERLQNEVTSLHE